MTTSSEIGSTEWRVPSSPTERLTFLEAGEKVLARRRARTSLVDYARLVFGIEPAAHHRLMLDALQGVFEGAIRKLLIIAPPGHAKSTYASIVFPSFYIGHRYSSSLIGVTTTDTLGRLYGDTVRNVIEQSSEWPRVFPGVTPDRGRGWSSDGFFLQGPKRRPLQAKDAALVFTGAGGPVIGRRADGVVIDDAVDEPTARSETLMEQRKLWIRRSVYSRLKPDGWRIVAGTLWAEGDVVDSAKEAGDFVTILMPAQSPGSIVEADVWIPDGVAWRPQMKYREG